MISAPSPGLRATALRALTDIDGIETEWSSTPLGWAARDGKKEMVGWLLKKGANRNLPGDEPWARPAEWAERRGRQGMMELLR